MAEIESTCGLSVKEKSSTVGGHGPVKQTILRYSPGFSFQNPYFPLLSFKTKEHKSRKHTLLLRCLGDSDCDQSPFSPWVWSKRTKVVSTTGCNKRVCNLKELLKSMYEWLSCTETQAFVLISHTREYEITKVSNSLGEKKNCKLCSCGFSRLVSFQ